MQTDTIETIYRLPVFRHQVINAESLADACAEAVAEENWDGARKASDSSGDVFVSGIWKGTVEPYGARPMTVPPAFEEEIQQEVALDSRLTSILKEPARPMGLLQVEVERWLPRALALIAEAERTRSGDPQPTV
ncbi:hypothetical protein [Aureimonas pseudogalii]|uniref:Uncharacterized protein n=1 Tax=Aureimonas pseudogalii TaxID=1744844 RepID=A0A7W6H791_9HYPH|nr:hypothetical protein [Aureimonas pseudogalii]MBB3999874.1 hypothetical protein [Aureimonas pseudogalii]